MHATVLLGLVAGTLTTISFVPQVIRTWRSKSAKDLSLGMFSLLALGTVLWLSYGILIDSVPVIVANAVTLLLSSVLIFFKLRYKD